MALLLGVWCTAVFATPSFQPLPTAMRGLAFTHVLKADSASCVLPFTMVGKLILVQGRADSTVGNFVLDTGAPDLVLNVTYFRQYVATEMADESQMGVTGEGSNVQKTTVKTFTLGSFNYYSAEASLVSLSAIENLRGVKILGLLGLGLFKDCELIIDYPKRLIPYKIAWSDFSFAVLPTLTP